MNGRSLRRPVSLGGSRAMGMATSTSLNRAATGSAVSAELLEEVLRLKKSCALFLCSIAWATASSAFPSDDPALSSEVFLVLPALRSNDADEQRGALSELRELAARKSDAPFAFALAEQNVMDA